MKVSARQLADERFPDVIRPILADHGVDGIRLALTLDVTNGVLIGDAEVVADRLAALRALGLLLSIADLGTGYASLGHLRCSTASRSTLDSCPVWPTTNTTTALCRPSSS